VEYVGEYANGAKGAAAAVTPAVADASASAPGVAPQIEIAPANPDTASAPAANTLEKGIKGFK
jgi:hypothetical protein